jgi:peptide/nickel transport system substrate-binding protein
MKNTKTYVLRSTLLFLFLLMTFLLGLTCSQQTSKNGNAVVIGITSDFDSLNELNASDADAIQVISKMLFMTLTRLDKNLQFKPYLATRWEFSANNETVTFYLRDDIYWSDGAKTTARDVLFTLETMMNPEVAYSAASRFDLVKEVKLIDDSTIRFHLKHAYPDVLFDLQFPILPEHILGELSTDDVLTSNFNRQPVCNGPFTLQSWEANKAVYFEANKNFAPGSPHIDRVIFSVLPEETVMLTNLLTQQIDLIPRISHDRLVDIKTATSIRSINYDSKKFSFIGWNCATPLFSTKMRRAFTQAINKEEIVNTLLQGFSHPMKGPFLTSVWAFDENIQDINYDLTSAKSILQSEGWVDKNGDGIREKNEEPLKFSLKFYKSRRHQDAAVMIQSQLKKIGAEIVIQQLDPNLFIDQVFMNKDFDAVVMTLDADFTVDPSPLWHSDEIESGFNFVSFSNSRIDELLKMARHAQDQETAHPLWAEFQQLIIDESPYTFLFNPKDIVACNKRITNTEFDIRGFLANIQDWQINK